MKGIVNVLSWIYNNWTLIIIALAFCYGIYRKVRKCFTVSADEKLIRIKNEVSQIMLHLVTEAEEDYEYLVKSGSIKRSRVIELLYDKYPMLSTVADQDALINWVDDTIDEALVTLREVIANQEVR